MNTKPENLNVKLALITGILRDEMREDPWGTLEQVAQIGYRGLEFGPGLMKNTGMSADQVKARLDDLGLATFSYGTVLHPDDASLDLDALIADAQVLGCDYLVSFWAPCESREQVLAYAEFFNEVGATLKAQGLTFCYHNHDHEFTTRFEGERGIDVLFGSTDPELVQAEIDVAWVRFGGADPAAHIEALAGRCPLIHLKDIYTDEERGAWTEVGTGIVDIRGAVEAGVRSGADWFIVEQDQARDLPPLESVRQSFDNLVEMEVVTR
jgi:sugar phosphate isomerase/epimerase